MNWETEVISPATYLLHEESKSTKWTPAKNKMFENALAVHDKETANHWYKVAAMIPGKTVVDVIKQYRKLEADVSNIERLGNIVDVIKQYRELEADVSNIKQYIARNAAYLDAYTGPGTATLILDLGS